MVNSAEKLLEFVHASPSPFHCAWEASKMLKAAGFTRVREGDEVTATVEIDHVMAPRVERQRGGVVERRDDGSIVIAVGVRNHDAFRSWVLGLRDHARVLGPPDLVDEFVGWLTSIAEAR